MTHPRMFEDDDPDLAWVRSICLAYPESAERVSHGRPNFFTVRTFCYYGGSERSDDGMRRHDRAVLVKPDPADLEAFRQDARFFVPAYLGPSGWVGADLDAVDREEVAELVDASYRVTAPTRLVRLLDAP